MYSHILKLVRHNRNIQAISRNFSAFQFPIRSSTTVVSRVSAIFPATVKPQTVSFCDDILVKPEFTRPGIFAKRGPLHNRQLRFQSYNSLFQDVHSYFVANGHVAPIVFNRVLFKLQNNIQEEQSLFLLESCAHYLPCQTPEKRMECFYKIWSHLKVNDLLKKPHYLKALQVFKKNRMTLSQVQHIFNDCPIKNDPQIYDGLIGLVCENGDIKQATEILVEMRNKNLPLTENIFNSLVLGHARNKDIVNAESVLETMKAANLEPNTETMSRLIQGYIENDEFEKAQKLMSEHEQNFNSGQVIKLIKCAAEKNQRSLVERLFKFLPQDIVNVKEMRGFIRNCCIELIYAGEIDKAYMILDCFPVPKFDEYSDFDKFGVFFVNEMIKSGQSSGSVIEISRKLMESNRNTRALHIACELALKRDQEISMDLLLALAENEKLKAHYFWPMLLSYHKKSGEHGVLEVMKTMSEMKIEFDLETLSHYCLPLLKLTLNNAENAMNTLENCGIKTSQFFTPITIHFIKQNKIEDVIKLNELYQSKPDTTQLITPLANMALNMRSANIKNYKPFANLVKLLTSKNENATFDLCGEILLNILKSASFFKDIGMLSTIIRELKAADVKISPVAAEAISNYLSKYPDDKKAVGAQGSLNVMIDNNLQTTSSDLTGVNLIHPRDMKYDELECHLVELESKNLNTRGVLRRLLQQCVRENRLERALEVKKKCDELKVIVSAGMMASIFDMHIKLKDLKAAENCMKNLGKQNNFTLDIHKVIDFAALLIENNQRQKALDILKKQTNSGRAINNDYINKNIWNLLLKSAQNAVSEPSQITSENLTKELFLILKDMNICEAKNPILGPIIREYLFKNDIKQAVREYTEITEKYKQTPLQFELMSLLVSISNGKDLDVYNVTENEAKELLQTIVTKTSKIHGTTNVNSCLLLAVAQSGTENQLRKLLINPEFRINKEALTRNCNHLSVTCSDTIMRLAKACRGLGHVLKEEDLYNILMNNFVRTNNHEAALSLFEKLQSDGDLKISRELLNNLIDLLRANNIEIPTEVSLKAQVKN